jgi:hypothetical protein
MDHTLLDRFIDHRDGLGKQRRGLLGRAVIEGGPEFLDLCSHLTGIPSIPLLALLALPNCFQR